jgi:hypothetical protein
MENIKFDHEITSPCGTTYVTTKHEMGVGAPHYRLARHGEDAAYAIRCDGSGTRIFQVLSGGNVFRLIAHAKAADGARVQRAQALCIDALEGRLKSDDAFTYCGTWKRVAL